MFAFLGMPPGGNVRFFGVFVALEAWGNLGKLWEGFGRLLRCLGDALGGFGDALGMLWEALGRLWEALGGFGEARRPPPNKKTTIYKNVGSKQTPDKPALLAKCYSNLI